MIFQPSMGGMGCDRSQEGKSSVLIFLKQTCGFLLTNPGSLTAKAIAKLPKTQKERLVIFQPLQSSGASSP